MQETEQTKEPDTPEGQDDDIQPENEPVCRWYVIAGKSTGTSHLASDTPCQDSFNYDADSISGMLVAAVSDGAGSAELSHIGSDVVASAAVKAATEFLQEEGFSPGEESLREVVEKATRAARVAIEAEAGKHERSLRDFAATLILAVCTPKFIATAHIGDGAAVVSSEVMMATDQQPEEEPDEGWGMVTSHENLPEEMKEEADVAAFYYLYSEPQRGEYANATNFITGRGWLDHLSIKVTEASVTKLALFTDGIQSLVLDYANGSAPHAPFFDPVFDWAMDHDDPSAASDDMQAFLASPTIVEKTDDDTTLLLAFRSETSSTADRPAVETDVDATTDDADTPLHVAAECGESEVTDAPKAAGDD